MTDTTMKALASNGIRTGGTMVKFFVWVLLIATSAAHAGDITFMGAKALADRDEGSLSAAQKLALIRAQAPIVQEAMPSCFEPSGQKPLPFVVVVELDSTGAVRKSWRSDESKLAECFQGVAAKARLIFSPPRLPFYSSFEMNLTADGISQ